MGQHSLVACCAVIVVMLCLWQSSYSTCRHRSAGPLGGVDRLARHGQWRIAIGVGGVRGAGVPGQITWAEPLGGFVRHLAMAASEVVPSVSVTDLRGLRIS